MKLIASPTSPYARKVRVVLLEKKIDCAVEFDIPWNAETTIPQYNPLGKIPVLVLDDNPTLFDSRVIVEYLEGIQPEPAIFPADFTKRIAAKRWEALADGLTDAAATIFLEKKRVAAQQSPEWISRQQLKITRALEEASKELGEKVWCAGNAYSIADIAVASALGYLDLRFSDLKWRTSHPNLAAWAEKVFARPAFLQTLPPP